VPRTTGGALRARQAEEGPCASGSGREADPKREEGQPGGCPLYVVTKLGVALRGLRPQRDCRPTLPACSGALMRGSRLGETTGGIDRPGRESHSQRRPAHESDPELFTQWQDFVLGSPPEHGVLVLDQAPSPHRGPEHTDPTQAPQLSLAEASPPIPLAPPVPVRSGAGPCPKTCR
jgi:hypothetical protein